MSPNGNQNQLEKQSLSVVSELASAFGCRRRVLALALDLADARIACVPLLVYLAGALCLSVLRQSAIAKCSDQRSFCTHMQAVVGAGAAGLAAARELLRAGHRVTVMEARHNIGGVWDYTDEVREQPRWFCPCFQGMRCTRKTSRTAT